MKGPAVKLSVSIPEHLLAFVEAYRREHGLESRSEVIARAVQLLYEDELRSSYRAASQEWDASEDAKLWESTSKDGLI